MRAWMEEGRDRIGSVVALVVGLIVVLLPLTFLLMGTEFLSWGVRSFRDQHGLYAFIWADQRLWLFGIGVVVAIVSGIAYKRSGGQKIPYLGLTLTAVCVGAVLVEDWFEVGALLVGGSLAMIAMRVFRADRLAAFGSGVVALPFLFFALATDYPETWYPDCAAEVQEELDARTHSMTDDMERWAMYAANEFAANQACDMSQGRVQAALRQARTLRSEEFRQIKRIQERFR